MTEPQAYIHIGAHRTGSSSFQNFLGLNRQKLEAAGCNLIYPARDGAPGGYDSKLWLPKPGASKKVQKQFFRNYVRPLRQRLSSLSHPDRPYTIISEENILGRMAPLFYGVFYPDAEIRAKTIFKAVNVQTSNVVLVVRNYADFFTSAYTMYARMRKRPVFEEVLPTLMRIESGWPDLIDRIRASARFGTLTIVPYEHRGNDCSLFNFLFPNAPETLTNPEKKNVSASVEAIAELQRRYHNGEKLTIQQRSDIVSEFSVAKGYERFAPFNKEDKAKLTERYKIELDALSRRSDVTIVGY